MNFVLDTNVLISQAAVPPGESYAISVATLAELEVGALMASDPMQRAQRLARLLDIANRFDALPFDEEVAHSYAAMVVETRRAGRDPRRRVIDTIIAATARAHDAAVVTFNTADFAPFATLVPVLEPGSIPGPS